jgi:serine/threonine protein kinase
MAPELMRGEAASVASDIYALGVLLFNLLTGKHPFEGENLLELKAAQQGGSPTRLMDERPDLPEQLAHAIERAMDFRPDQRYGSTGQMIAALSDAAGLTASSTESTGPVRLPQKRHWPLWAAVPAVLALLFLGAARCVCSRPAGQTDPWVRVHMPTIFRRSICWITITNPITSRMP